MTEMRSVVDQLKSALDDVEKESTHDHMSRVAMEEFKVTVDTVRTSVLAMLDAADPTNYHDYLRRFRFRRANQVCQNVLSGLIDGTITPETPALDELRATVDETLERIALVRGG